MFTCHYRRALAWLKDCRGANLVEAALVTPLLLLLTFAIADFGGLFYAYLALESGVSQATRFGVTGQTLDDPDNPGNTLSRTDSIKAAMRRATPTLTIPDGAFAFSHLPQGSTVWVAGTGGPNEIERVQINYDWQLMTPLVAAFFPNGQLRLTVSSSMKNEPRFD
jgi:Flp pilus assembly protein TadG